MSDLTWTPARDDTTFSSSAAGFDTTLSGCLRFIRKKLFRLPLGILILNVFKDGPFFGIGYDLVGTGLWASIRCHLIGWYILEVAVFGRVGFRVINRVGAALLRVLILLYIISIMSSLSEAVK